MLHPACLLRRVNLSPQSFITIGLLLTMLIWVSGAGVALHSRVAEEDRARAMAAGVAETLAFNMANTLGNIHNALADLSREFGDNWKRYTIQRSRAISFLQASLSGVPVARNAIVIDAEGRLLHRFDRGSR